MQDPLDQPLKSNVLPFPSLKAMPPDPPKPSLLKGMVGLVVLAAAASLLLLTMWALITL